MCRARLGAVCRGASPRKDHLTGWFDRRQKAGRHPADPAGLDNPEFGPAIAGFTQHDHLGTTRQRGQHTIGRAGAATHVDAPAGDLTEVFWRLRRGGQDGRGRRGRCRLRRDQRRWCQGGAGDGGGNRRGDKCGQIAPRNRHGGGGSGGPCLRFGRDRGGHGRRWLGPCCGGHGGGFFRDAWARLEIGPAAEFIEPPANKYEAQKNKPRHKKRLTRSQEIENKTLSGADQDNTNRGFGAGGKFRGQSPCCRFTLSRPIGITTS